jgi:phospholipid-binding lipoprotein MlaA
MLRSAAAAMVLIACPTAAAAGGLQPSDDSPFVAGLAAAPADVAADTTPVDPWERQNRKFFAVNEKLDARVIRPTALGYEKKTPGPLRRGIRNFLSNLSEPVVFANDVLQFRFNRAGTAATRFVTNSTVGLGGLFDVAGQSGIEHHANGFGTTLGRYHVPAGPYVYLPVVGPSTVRDLAGAGVDGLMDPFSWGRFANHFAVDGTKTVVDGLDTRARADGDLQALTDTAADPYATLRSAYLQSRQAEIEGELGGKLRDLPAFDDPAEDKAPPAQPSPDSTGWGKAAPDKTTPDKASPDKGKPDNGPKDPDPQHTAAAAATIQVFTNESVQRNT